MLTTSIAQRESTENCPEQIISHTWRFRCRTTEEETGGFASYCREKILTVDLKISRSVMTNPLFFLDASCAISVSVFSEISFYSIFGVLNLNNLNVPLSNAHHPTKMLKRVCSCRAVPV